MSYSDWKIFLDNDANIYEYFDIASLKKYVPLWQDVFGENFFCLPYNLIKQKPKSFMQKIEKKLKLSEFNYTNLNEVVHKSPKFNFTSDSLQFLKDKLNPEYQYIEKNFKHYI